MGMPVQSVALLLMEHRRRPFVGPALIYGVQRTNLTFAGALLLFEYYGIQPMLEAVVPRPADHDTVEIPQIFAMMGLGTSLNLDVSPHEGAEIVANLNDPVSDELLNRFGLILDGGTMEHVFDIRQGMANTVNMLRVGGSAVHITPSNNYFNHGFVQVSPTLYHDYYAANALEDLRGFVIVHPRRDYIRLPWKLIEYDPVALGGANSMFCDNRTQLALYFSAHKTATSTSNVIPIQAYFDRTPEQQVLENHQYLVGYDPDAPTLDLVTDVESPTIGKLADLIRF